MKKKAFVECFSNFMSEPEGLAQEDLVAELKEQEIDVSQLKIDVAEIVKRGSEERRLGWRRRAKQKMEEIEKLIGITKTIPDAAINVKDKIAEFIKDTYGPGSLNHAEAYFRNKGTLSEIDIKNLFEDLEQLESLEKSGSKKD
jgi:hypothetical protein